MTAHAVAVDALLVLAVALTLVCCLGVLVMPSTYDRVHYLGPASVVVPALVAAAVVVEQGLSPLGIKAILAALLLAATGPVLGHATARSAAVRDGGLRHRLDDAMRDEEG